MADIYVCVPRAFGLERWIDEGDPAGAEWTGQLWAYTTYGAKPEIVPGDRVYIFYSGKLRGYAPLVRLEYERGRVTLIRGGGAVAVTIPRYVAGFRGWRYVDWEREEERPYPGWRTP